jgi:N-succinyldiaminopimelate aminotransferase
MNPDLDKLQPYPFEKLAKLKSGITQPPGSHIALSIGEPKHPTPELIIEALTSNLDGLAKYPSTKGLPELRKAIASWTCRRFNLPDDALDIERQVLPVNGTREALFAFAQAVIDHNNSSLVLMPNPFYQIYEGASLLAGATPAFINSLPENGYLPDFDSVDEATWQQCDLIYICSPGNPTGAVMSIEQLQQLIRLSDQYDFVIASDECYSELYFDEDAPPPGLLQAAQATGRNDFKNCVIFHSLSKRSNAPGLRSGFVAGDANIISHFFNYRTYHGCAMPIQHQMASIAAWNDEKHVQQNRDLYRKKFAAVIDILKPVLDVKLPDASFYLWIKTPVSDEEFARRLFEQENVTVLPGSYLSRDNNGHTPGKNHVRMALVATLEECIEAAQKIKRFCENM